MTGGKDHRTQDPAWLSLKLAYKIGRPGATPVPYTSSAYALNYNPAQSVFEPPYTGSDAAGHSYTDEYMWNLCGPGATTATLGYWSNPNLNIGGHTYTDPHTSTYWNNSNYRSYIMYIATQTDPPYYTSPGEETYQTYPSAYASFDDVRDALNWEASGHSSGWFNYFYTVVGASSLTLSNLQSDVQNDILNAQVPLIVSVNDGYLPDWPSGSHTSHFVTIIGYNNTADFFTYAETCGSVSCGTQGTGIWTVNQQQLFNGIENDNGNGGIIW